MLGAVWIAVGGTLGRTEVRGPSVPAGRAFRGVARVAPAAGVASLPGRCAFISGRLGSASLG